MPPDNDNRPPATIAALPAEKLDLTAVTPLDAQLSVQGGNLVITPPDPPPVVVTEFAAAAAIAPPPVTVADGVVIPADQLLAIVEGAGDNILVADLIAEYLEHLQPAAGSSDQGAVPLSTASHTTASPDDQPSVRTTPDATFVATPLPEIVATEGPDPFLLQPGPAPITTPPAAPAAPSPASPPPAPAPNASVLGAPTPLTTTLDTESVMPFQAFTINHPDPAALLTISVAFDDTSKGAFTPGSLTASGFVATGPGIYSFVGTAAQAQQAIRQLAFDPANNHVALSGVDDTSFTVSSDDGGIGTVANSATHVWATPATGSAANNDVTLPFPVAIGTVDLAGGADMLRLADGRNTLSVRNVETLVGATGADVIGIAGANTMAISGVETLTGSAGNDALLMTSVLTGALVDLGAGTDVLRVATVSENMIAVAGVETIAGSTANNILTLTSNLNGSTVTMDFGQDMVNLAPGANTLRALNAETINGSAADDTITFTGTLNQVSLNVGGGTDTVALAGGNNLVTVNGVETLTSGAGNDRIALTSPVSGGTLDLGGGTDSLGLVGAANTLAAIGIETLTGSTGNNNVTLTANVSGGTINLGTGVDVLTLAAGANSFRPLDAETIFGSAGNDVLSFTAAVTQATVDLAGGTDTLTLADVTNLVTVRGVETLTGGSGNDMVRLADTSGSLSLGGGTDTVDVSMVGSVNLAAAGTQYQGIERLDMRGGLVNTTTLNAQDVLDLSPTTDTLLVRGSYNDRVAIGNGWTASGTQTNPSGESGTFNVYTQNVGGQTATLLVESQVPVS